MGDVNKTKKQKKGALKSRSKRKGSAIKRGVRITIRGGRRSRVSIRADGGLSAAFYTFVLGVASTAAYAKYTQKKTGERCPYYVPTRGVICGCNLDRGILQNTAGEFIEGLYCRKGHTIPDGFKKYEGPN